MEDRNNLVNLASFLPFGPQRIKLLLAYFGSAGGAWNASEKALSETGLHPNLIVKFCDYRSTFNPDKYFAKLEKLGIHFVTFKDSDYPSNLVGLSDLPIVLYIKGKLTPQDTQAIAIVGSRKMTAYGRDIAQMFAGQLASFGVTIVSGLALGIDAAAQRASTEAGGRVIAVLGSGLDTIAPFTNYRLGMEIIKTGGALVSEFPVGYPPQKFSFPRRNRIISGLSKAVIVVEGAEKSGTLITAKAAAEQGRTVFAVPGQITSPLSFAPHLLIRNGCPLATSVHEILEELQIQFSVDREAVSKVLPGDDNEQKCLEALSHESMHLDELARECMLPVSQILAKLTVMELKGMVKHLGNGVYKKI